MGYVRVREITDSYAKNVTHLLIPGKTREIHPGVQQSCIVLYRITVQDATSIGVAQGRRAKGTEPPLLF